MGGGCYWCGESGICQPYMIATEECAWSQMSLFGGGGYRFQKNWIWLFKNPQQDGPVVNASKTDPVAQFKELTIR